MSTHQMAERRERLADAGGIAACIDDPRTARARLKRLAVLGTIAQSACEVDDLLSADPADLLRNGTTLEIARKLVCQIGFMADVALIDDAAYPKRGGAAHWLMRAAVFSGGNTPEQPTCAAGVANGMDSLQASKARLKRVAVLGAIADAASETDELLSGDTTSLLRNGAILAMVRRQVCQIGFMADAASIDEAACPIRGGAADWLMAPAAFSAGGAEE